MKMAAGRGCGCVSRNKRRGAGRGKKSAPPASRPSRAPSLSLSPPTSGNWSSLVWWIMRSLRSRAADQVDFFGRSVLPQPPTPIRRGLSLHRPLPPHSRGRHAYVGKRGRPQGAHALIHSSLALSRAPVASASSLRDRWKPCPRFIELN